MTTPDYLTLFLYLVGLFVISTVSAKRTTSQQDMFAAGRSSPWWAAGLSGFMTMFSAATFVVWGGIAYEYGFVAVAINTCYGIAALAIGYFAAARWNRLNISTPAEFVRLRFGKTGLHFFTWIMLFKRILGVSVSLYALSKLLVALMPLDLNWAIILFGSIIILYTMQGGLWAVLMTDVLQFIVLTVVVFMVAVLMISRIDSASDFIAAVPESFFSPTADKYGWFFLCGWVTIHFFMIGAEWAFVQRFLAVRSPSDARKSAYLFGVLYLVTPLFWLLPPLLYRGQVEGVDKEQAYILAAQSVLPPGVLGLMIAAMFSATASMVSSQLNVFAGVLTNDFFKAMVQPNASERTLVFVGRVFTVVLGILLVATAIIVPQLGGAEKLIVTINNLLVVPLYAPTLWGLFSRKIGIRDMVIVILTSFTIGAVLRFGFVGNPWIAEGDALYAFANFLADNTKNVEVLVGVLLPVAMLFAIEWLKKTDDVAGGVVTRMLSESSELFSEQPATTPFDPFPIQMVMTSVLFIGGWMFLLGLWQEQSRAVLMIFAFILLFLGGALRVWLVRRLSAA
ncbi:MAG: Na+:solute symporter [Blastopirellula sp.]|nr:MAG: Na+:solute symporter [Blastopirellula sp.]